MAKALPQRPRPHWLEDESRRAFEAALARRFKFYSRTQPEYGIDGEVEEFDNSGVATGLHFFVQLKGTDEEEQSKGLAADIKVSTANYYRAAELPVLMVRYHAPTQALHARWFHQYDPYEGRGGTKTLRFRWGTEDLWHDGTPGDLAADARAFLDLRKASLRQPVPIHLVTPGAFGISTAEISIALRAATSERADVLELRSGEPPAGSPWIKVNETEIRADLAKVTGATFHIRDSEYANDLGPEQIAVDALTMVALAFERLGQDDITSRLASTYFARSSMVAEFDLAFALSSSMARAHRISEALELSDQLDDLGWEQLEDAAIVFGFPALYKARSLSAAEIKQHEQVLKARVKRRKKRDPLATARAYMNLAGFHRGHQRWDAAANYYREAQKLDPSYSDRAYFWFEYGGALWGTRQYSRAAEAYGRSIELGTTQPLAPALQADSLLFSGRYAAALELLDRYNAAHPEDDGEYRLKARACRAIVVTLGIREQDRQTHQSVQATDKGEQKRHQEWAAMSRRQLGLDALWGSAWLNLGLSQHHLSQYSEALDSFVASTILMPEDYETWQNAMFTAFRVREVEVLRDLVVSGRRMGGDALIAKVVRAATEQKYQVSGEFTGIVDGILAKQPPPRAGFTVRMIREDGSVEEVPIEDERHDSR